MNSLRFLLVHRDPEQSEEIASRLAEANHTVVPTAGLDEAADALTVEQFDAVLMESVFRRPGLYKYGLQEFSALLRRMEQSQKSGNHVPVIAIDDGTAIRDESCIDAVMPEPIDPDALTATVSQLARALAKQNAHSTANGASNGGKSLDVLNPEKFKEQVGFDSDLMVEIIDLFLDERQRQEPEMRDALEAGKFDLLSRLAHTIKGSLGSLHAMRARSHAQELEIAAKQRDEDVCWEALAALEADLAQLEPELLALRQGV
jgi:HPt (histidine-containing phosphotransfer) domain-containing protein/CheY-like chemotaxis protein